MWVKPYSWCPIHLSFNEKNIRKVETSRWKGWRLEFIFWMLWNATEPFLMSSSQIIARQKFTSGMFCRHTQVTTRKSGRKPQSFGRVQEVQRNSRDDTLRFFQPFIFFFFIFSFCIGLLVTNYNVSHAKIISCQTRQVNSQFFSRVADNRHRLLLVFCFSKFVCVLPIPICVLFFSLLFSNKTDHSLMNFFQIRFSILSGRRCTNPHFIPSNNNNNKRGVSIFLSHLTSDRVQTAINWKVHFCYIFWLKRL